MDRLDDGVWSGGQETVDAVRAGDRLGLGAAFTSKFGPDASETVPPEDALAWCRTKTRLSQSGFNGGHHSDFPLVTQYAAMPNLQMIGIGQTPHPNWTIGPTHRD
jgi:hypothetical protein